MRKVLTVTLHPHPWPILNRLRQMIHLLSKHVLVQLSRGGTREADQKSGVNACAYPSLRKRQKQRTLCLLWRPHDTADPVLPLYDENLMTRLQATQRIEAERAVECSADHPKLHL